MINDEARAKRLTKVFSLISNIYSYVYIYKKNCFRKTMKKDNFLILRCNIYIYIYI